MNYRLLLFLIAAFTTVFCAAVNAYTLRIAYPLWQWVGPGEFAAVHQNYLRLLEPVITFPHIIMFFASAALIRYRPGWFSLREAIWLFALDAAVVAVSAFGAGPIHSGFERTGVLDPAGLHWLLVISALRTVLMFAACGVAGSGLYRALVAVL